MANSQPLSPQGYNIKDNPVNNNPFWGEQPVDPSVYTRLDTLEYEVGQLQINKADATDVTALYNLVTAQGQDITALQNEVNGVNTVLDTILNIGGE